MSVDSRKITLTQGDDGGWTAHDDERGLTAEGDTRVEALERLDGVVAAAEGTDGRPPTDEELREWGIDPEENRRRKEGEGDLPEFLQ